MRLLHHVVIGGAALLLLARGGLCEGTAETQPELRTAHAVPVKYYLALPNGWTARTPWPILVCIDGSGHDFLGNCRAFIHARGDRPFVIVTPHVSSNGNDPADLKAVLAIVREVQKEFNGQPRFFITGFSAGGHLTWQVIFSHPELLAGAVLAAANFRFRGISTISKSPARVPLPIHAIQGDRDGARPALDQQWRDPEQLAHRSGYQNLTHTIVPEAGHQPFPQEVIDFFSTLLPK